MKNKILEILHGNGEKFAGILLFTAIVSFLIYGFWHDSNYYFECIGESKVVEILELKHRDAIILLENGMKIEVNQAHLKLGDNYCYESRKVKRK